MELHQNQNGLIPMDKFNWEGMCIHPEHNPPSHLYIPQGYIYKHTCPSCGCTVYLQPDVITC